MARAPTTRSERRKIGPSNAAAPDTTASCPRGVRAGRGFEAFAAFLTPRLLAFAGILGYLSAVSLSTFVERKDVKEYLRLNVPKPWFMVKAEIKAPPLTTSYGWTGTAFDYAMRFYLQKINRCAKARRWLAEESAAMVRASGESARTKKRVRTIVETAKDCLRSYLKNRRDQRPGDELICAATNLAQLDLVYRIGLLDLQPIKKPMVEDIGNMLALVRPEDFRAKRTCLQTRHLAMPPCWSAARTATCSSTARLWTSR